MGPWRPGLRRFGEIDLQNALLHHCHSEIEREREKKRQTDRESKTEDIETPRHSKRGPVGQKHHEISFFNVTEVSEGNRAADPIGA